MTEGQAYTGTIKSFNPDKGWGFVECPALGADAMVIRHDLNGFIVGKGDAVSFGVKQTEKGYQAVNITVVGGADGSQMFQGEVKSWNEAKGFGFLSSATAQQMWGKDVFVLKSQFPGGMTWQGAPVQFRASVGDKGPAAVGEVKILGGQGGMAGWGGAAGWAGQGAMAGWGGQQQMGWGGAAAAWGGAAAGTMWGDASWGGAPVAKQPQEHEVFYGTVKQVNVEKGWGHVACQAMQKLYGRDIFVMKASLDATPGLVQGQSVSFNVTQGPRGPHATNIRIVDASLAAQVFTGTVKTFNETKGWGFIESPETQHLFAGDVFVHQRDLGSVTIKPGEQVTFSLDTSGGRAFAKNVSNGTAGYAAITNGSAAARASPY